ncbi:eukaryotic translation initiation factor 2-alpha kinase 1 isoform X2 [Megalopta genalis]|uniref:eukaryotic translation initiation factor 2-alpha kinase 1 isoform X2 n=1 Tax=Megalopta genalis TaxID=115081 RepID=UPI0014433365|nr:eukaryotic translation initiation factor 2-alpha kinase 1-like isoform X2 [Megalopta genalis]
MEDNHTPVINPWDTLSTVTKFDRGKDTNTTVCMNNDGSQTKGQVVSIVTPSISLLIESLIQQLCTLFEDDIVRRNKLYFAICDRLHEMKLIDGSYNMMEFESLRGQYQHALYHLVRVARAATGSENIIQMPSSLTTEWSRYHREFQEISFIASGGFGHVFKALHRLDGTEYAVKKIIVRSGRVKSIIQHLEEVKTLAKLNHTNIISYKGAWIEPTLPSICTKIIPSLPSSNYSENKISSVGHKKKNRYKSCTKQSFGVQNEFHYASSDNSQSPSDSGEQDMLLQYNKKINYKSGQRIVEENIERTTSNSISFRNDSKNLDDKMENNTNYTDGTDSCEGSNSNNKLCPYIPQTNEQCVTLYIQMALCEKTLQQWLSERNEQTSQTMIIGMLTQILCGLNYIHSRGIVHHDIKPSNIFVSMSGSIHIQLGDFGLACPLQRENHRSILGTQMYAAPEQLEGKCDPKSDIYSLGIVLLELLVHTKTHMERVEIITSVKRGHIPTMLTATYPKWAHIVSQLVQADPEKRPSTSQLLQDLNEDKDMTIAQLKSTIVIKNNKIQALEDRISRLKALITKHNITIDDM